MAAKSKATKQAANRAANRAAVQSTPVSDSQASSLTLAGAGALAIRGKLPEGIVMTRRLQLPTLVLKKPGEMWILGIIDAVKTSKVKGKQLKVPVKLDDGTMQTHEPPASVATVANVQTGETYTLLLPAVVKSVFEQEYPGDTYVGKAFAIENLGKREGKRHVDFSVCEVDISAFKPAQLTAPAPGAVA